MNKMNSLPIKMLAINQEYAAGSSISIIVYMIDRCNFSCQYCINKFPRTLQAIDIYQLFNFLNQLFIYSKKKLVIELAGGEPLIHPKIIDFVQMLSQSQIDYHLSITTNLSYPFSKYKKIIDIARCDFVFSYHVAEENIVNQFNSFFNKIAQIDSNYYRKCCIRILYNNLHTEHCLKVLDYTIQKYSNQIRIEFCQLLPTQHYLPTYTIEQMSAYNAALAKILNSNTQNEYLVQYNDGSIRKFNIYDICVSQIQVMSNFHLWHCDAGYLNYYVQCDGSIYPCANYFDQYQKPLANISERHFDFKKINKRTLCLLHSCRCEFPLAKERLIRRGNK